MVKIGVTPCFLYPDIERRYFGPKYLAYLERDMARYLYRKDVMPILIPDLDTPELQEFLSHMDGIVLQGGSDMSPESYNEPFLDKEKWPGDKYRDDFEFKVLDFAMDKKLPIYGICRGFQVINAYFKGTLHQDIGRELKTDIEHRHAEKYDTIKHQATIEKGGLLEKIYPGKERIEINTVHHQCVKTVGEGLRVEAKSSEDGIVEAFSHTENNFVLGVQWHPEFSPTLGDQLDDPNPLYDYFLQQIKR